MSARLGHRASRSATFTAFLHRQLILRVPALPVVDLSSKVAVVTGSNVGLGLECARHLLSLRLSRLILAVRSRSKGEAAASELQAAFPNTQIEVWILDMESYHSILSFVQRCHTELGRIDIAVLNAGMVQQEYKQSVNLGQNQRHETIFQVNYLSTALLAISLLPLLNQPGSCEPGRMTFVGSDTTYWAKFPKSNQNYKSLFEVADNPHDFDGFDRYKSAKLFVMMFVARLCQDIVSPENVVVNVACPGLCKGTAFTRDQDASWAKRVAFDGLLGLIGRSASKGAKVYINAAITQGPQSQGSMLSEGRILP